MGSLLKGAALLLAVWVWSICCISATVIMRNPYTGGAYESNRLVLELADNTGLFFVIYAPLALALFWTGVYTKHSAKLSRETDLMLDAIEARIISLKGLK
jgi:hypothetical protein